MIKQRLFAIVVLVALLPMNANAHAQFVSHPHSDSGFWFSLVPEVLLIALFLAGVWRLLGPYPKADTRLEK